MSKLHVFGCSVTQGFALPDVVKPILHSDGTPLTDQEIQDDPTIHWGDIHLYQPSDFAWPQVLADQLGYDVLNHARRGACFNQIARQVAVHGVDIPKTDVAIVMWTYNSRMSLQWPQRTTVPLCTEVDTSEGVWRTVTRGFNRLVGLDPARTTTTPEHETQMQRWIKQSTTYTYMDPRAVWDRYYNNLVTQTLVDGTLRSNGARVIHLSVEPESAYRQLEGAYTQLHTSLQAPYNIPDPKDWYNISVDHDSCSVILDPSIPTAENDMHPSVTHHSNFATHLRETYFA